MFLVRCLSRLPALCAMQCQPPAASTLTLAGALMHDINRDAHDFGHGPMSALVAAASMLQ